MGGERADEKDGEPAHADVHGRGDVWEAIAGEDLEDDADEGEKPCDGEDCPAKGAVQRAEGEGGVGACDEAEDGEVIEHPEEGFSPDGEGVVQGGGEVKQGSRAGEEGYAKDGTELAMTGGGSEEEGGCGENGQEADAVADGVGDFLAEGLEAVRVW